MDRPLRKLPLSYPDRPFHHFIEDAATTFPERTALLFEDERYTFGEMNGASNALADALYGMGIRPEMRVALCMSNRPEWIVSFFALSKLGASIVLFSIAWKESEIRHALALTEPDAVLADGASVALLEQVGRPEIAVSIEENAGWSQFWPLLHSGSGTRDNALDGDLRTRELVLGFSSGTTGKPKAVRHSHHTMVVSAIQWAAALNMSDSDSIQAYTPLAHILGILNIASAASSGMKVRLFPRFDLERALRSIEEDRITIGIGMAPIATAMANLPDLETYDLSSLRYFSWSSTPVNETIAHRFTERTGVQWLTAYGATESPHLCSNPVLSPHLWRLDTVGIAGADVEVRIADPVTGTTLPEGEQGEILVRGPGTMLGYLPEEANKDTFWDGGWFRTGDIGWLEPEGWLHITDRLKEMIKVSGFQVTPAEIESVLSQHDSVADCAVFGVQDGLKGEVPHAVVIPKQAATVTSDELTAWMEGRVASYKRLAAIHVVEEIPRTASGKALRRQLSIQYAGGEPA